MKRRARRGFEAMPERLRRVGAHSSDKLKRERDAWLEEHNLALVDLQAFKRAEGPLARIRPPSRRRFMSAEKLAEFDRQREQEGDPKW